ncbi:AI-2E family transporter [Bradyrhizobium sp. AUGA SZCCT0283]|nr:AI-2E family transporter [Bradyrhizobium sp. AUGA SZCCT0283]
MHISTIGTRVSAPRCGGSTDREVASAYDRRLGRGKTIVSVIPTKPVPAKPSPARPLASKSPPTRPLPGERQLPNGHEGTPVPDSRNELPPVIRRTEVVAIALVGLLIICIIAGLYLARAFFLPITMAFIVGTMLSPAASFLERCRIPRAIAAVLIVATAGAGATFMVGMIASPAVEWSGKLPELGALLKEKLHVFDRPLALWQELQSMLGGPGTLTTLHLPKIDWVQPTLEFLSPTFAEFLLFAATLILFIASWRDLRRAMIMNFGERTARLRTLRMINEIEEHLGNYLLMVTTINVGVGVVTGLICAVTGMPNPAGLGALAAILNFIPIIGPVAMFAVLVVVGQVAFPSIGAGLLAPALFAAMTFLEGHFLTPMIVGRRLELNALAVFIALAFWTWLWGPMGAFLSSPLLIVALIVKEHLMPPDSPQLPED